VILHRTISQLVIICLTTQVGFGQSSLRNQLEALVGERPEVETHHSVREAAQEYIVGRQFAALDQHGLALAHFRHSAELDNHAAAPWIGMAISLAAIGRVNCLQSIIPALASTRRFTSRITLERRSTNFVVECNKES